MKTYIFGDIHGEFTKFRSTLDKIPYTKEDRFIFLGDYVDRGLESCQLIDFLIKFSSEYECHFILGNHDVMWLEGMMNFNKDDTYRLPEDCFNLWNQGAYETFKSYINLGRLPNEHIKFFQQLKPYFIDEENNFYVHGGFNRHKFISEQAEFILYWDRDLWSAARSWEQSDKIHPFKMKDSFKEVFIGHTPVNMWGNTTPQRAANIWNLDTGAGKWKKEGRVSCIELTTKRIYQN